MKPVFINKNSINWKLLTPSFAIIIIIVAMVYFMASLYISKEIKKSARIRASEIAETFHISTEADGSVANIVRTNNSIATFDEINGLYVIDPEVREVIASSNYYYKDKKIQAISEPRLKKIFLKAEKSKKNKFIEIEALNYIYIYQLVVNSENNLSFKKYRLVIDLDGNNLSDFFKEYVNLMMMVFLFAFLFAMIAFYLGVSKRVIVPLKNLLGVIDQRKILNKPVTYDYESKDELGSLVSTYNKMIVEEFEQKDQLIKAKEISEAASKAKGEFLSVMSHEIRTPLNGVVGGCAFLEKTNVNDEQIKHIHMIKESSQQLLLLVNDILDFSKIESGKISLENQPVDLQRLIKHILIIFEAEAQDKNISLEYQAPDKDIPVVLCDQLRFKQILINIISNAIKFTASGGVVVSFENYQVNGKRFEFTLKIEDTGIGINEEKAGDLFQSFTQADTSTTRKYGGSGLGLTISKQLTEIMQGKIWYKSTPGVGTVFCLQYTFEISQLKAENSDDIDILTADVQMPASTILLVEDTEVNVMIATQLLEELGHTVDVSVNGEEAVKKVAENEYDLILMDCFMPVMDGYEATRLIRQYEKKHSKTSVPVIALTADVSVENREKCQSVGMDDFIVKPYEPSQVYKTLAMYLSHK